MKIDNEVVDFENEVEFICVVRTDKMSDAEKAKFIETLEVENGIVVDGVRFETLFGSGKMTVTEEGNFRFEAYGEKDCNGNPDGNRIFQAVMQLMKDLGITSDFSLRFRSFEFSCYGEYDIENGVATFSEFRRCYDYMEFMSPMLEKKGVKLRDVIGESFEVKSEDPEVFKAMQNPDVNKWMYWVGNDELYGFFLKLMPSSMADLRTFVSMACLSSGSFEETMEKLDDYYDLRLENYAANSDLPESLKETQGLWLYETQKDDAEKLGLTCACGEPVIYMSAKIIAASMYLFAYMCVKYDLHKELA